MIPVKIISKKEAIKLGLAKREGEAVSIAASFVASKGPDGKEIIVEKSILKLNGEKEIIFISEDRKKDLLKQEEFENYLNQFNKIEGKDRETFLKEEKLKQEEQLQ
ncbi:MAG TPA: hypothetical protein VGB37_16320 [Candidatus Lokiarchaeia archaeon]